MNIARILTLVQAEPDSFIFGSLETEADGWLSVKIKVKPEMMAVLAGLLAPSTPGGGPQE